MSEANKYRKKPVVIEAMQVTSENFKSLSEWLPHDGTALILASPGRVSVHIETLEGKMIASPGDFIIKGVQGEFYPCKPDIFEQTYEVAE